MYEQIIVLKALVGIIMVGFIVGVVKEWHYNKNWNSFSLLSAGCAASAGTLVGVALIALGYFVLFY